jgi:hypothetical protein
MFLNLEGITLKQSHSKSLFFPPRSGQCQGAELFDTGFQMAVATTTTLGLWRWRLIPKVYYAWVNYNDLTSRNNTLKWWFIYGNHPQMVARFNYFQEIELLYVIHIYTYICTFIYYVYIYILYTHIYIYHVCVHIYIYITPTTRFAK